MLSYISMAHLIQMCNLTFNEHLIEYYIQSTYTLCGIVVCHACDRSSNLGEANDITYSMNNIPFISDEPSVVLVLYLCK